MRDPDSSANRLGILSGVVLRRMSHNPVQPGLYDILDRVGVVAMDETRILGTDDVSVMNMGAMVKRDRNHASVIIWSYCNEQGCGNGTGSMGPDGAGDTEAAEAFHAITMHYDKTRATLGNMPNFAPDSTSVAGFSEGTSGSKFDFYNSQHPTRPKFASECCNCHSDRDREMDGHDIISCAASKSKPSDNRDFVVGTMVSGVRESRLFASLLIHCVSLRRAVLYSLVPRCLTVCLCLIL